MGRNSARGRRPPRDRALRWWRPASSSRGWSMKRITASAIVAILTAALVWAQGPTQFHPGFNLFTKAQDVQLGQENAAQVRKQLTVIHDPFLTEYVTRVGKRLVSAREAQE